MDKQEKNILYRYSSILILGIIFLSSYFVNLIIYIFTYLSYYFLNIFTNTKLENLKLTINNTSDFLIVKACIAPEAYLLISFIFIAIPISFKQIKNILPKALLWFSIFNLIRIFLLMWIFVKFGVYWFDKLHLIFYEGLSGIITALICVYYLRKEKIKKKYPIYTDIKYLIEKIKRK